MINVEMLKDFREDFADAMKYLEKKYNLDITLGNISYSDSEFSSKIKVVQKIEGKSSKQVEFEKYCKMFDLKSSDYKRPVESPVNGKNFILIGFNIKAKKYPYIIESIDSKECYRMAHINFI